MTSERIFSILRNILTIVGGWFIGKSLFGEAIDTNTLELLIGVVMSLAGTIWSIVDKTVTIEKIQGTVRHVISVIGGALVASGKISAENLELILGIILALIPIIQGYFSRKKVQAIESGKYSVNQLKSR